MKYVALVPARGQSKSIPHKNIKNFCGKPLIYWVCKAAQECRYIDLIYVSTDDEAIGTAALNLGLDKVRTIERDQQTATDTASTESVMLDFASRVDFDNILLLQATSPLLTSQDLEQAIALYETGECDGVISAVRQHRFIWQENDNSTVSPLNYSLNARPRRQDHDGFLVENGAFYLTSRERLLKDRCRLSGKIKCIEMPSDTYYEIDEPDDWAIAESLLYRRLKREKGALKDRLKKIKLVLTDVDGVLTDSGMYYNETGDELKKFNTRDGKGFELLRNAGLTTGIITSEDTEIVARRAHKLKVDELHQGAVDKVEVLTEIIDRLRLDWDEVAFIGDDLGDVEVLQRVGVSAAPADAIPEILSFVDLRLNAKGGNGAFREFAEMIIDASKAGI